MQWHQCLILIVASIFLMVGVASAVLNHFVWGL
jgi:hypothetical protein